MSFNTRSNLQTYGRNGFSVGLGKTKAGPASITRTFNFCNLTAPDLQFAFACTFGRVDRCPNLPKNTPYQICSPWPHFGGLDNTNSRYTTILGTQNGNNINTLNSSFTNFLAQTSSAISSDGTIYTGYNLTLPVQGYLIAFNSNGLVKWYYKLVDGDYFLKSNPTIGPTGVIYFGSNSGYIYAINPNGSLLWKRLYTCSFGRLGYEAVPLSINGSIIIGNYNQLYFGGNATITVQVFSDTHTFGLTNVLSVNSTNGEINFQFDPLSSVTSILDKEKLSLCIPYVKKDIAIDKYDNLYFCFQYEQNPNNSVSSNYISNLVCINNLGIEKFTYKLDNNSTIISYPILSEDNSLTYLSSYIKNIDSQPYNITYYITAVDNNTGKKNSANSTNIIQNISTTNVIIDEGSLVRDNYDNLYLLSKNMLFKIKNGVLIWQFNGNNGNIDGEYSSYPTSSALVGKDGTIYFPTTIYGGQSNTIFIDNQLVVLPIYSSYLYAINSNGIVKWYSQFPQTPNNSIQVFNSPAMKSNGNIILHTTIRNNDALIFNSGFYEFS